jgi:hypothetical protein
VFYCASSSLCIVVTLLLLIISKINVKVKVKCTLVQALRLYTGRTAHRGSRGIALLYRH